MRFLKWLFDLGDLDAYYVPRLKYEALQQELAEAQRLLVATQQAKAKVYDYAERELGLMRGRVAKLESRNVDLSLANRWCVETHSQLLSLLEYNNVPGSMYVWMPGPVCSSINQEAVTLLHRRFETCKDAI